MKMMIKNNKENNIQNKEIKEEKCEKARKKEKTEKKEQTEKKQEGKKGANLFGFCDLRVGFVQECKIMEGFNDIYSLKIDLGEPEIRIIGTGLRNHVPISEIQSSKVIVFSNLKPKRFGENFISNGMIMCASDGSHQKIELIRPSKEATPGDKVYLDGTELDPKVEPTLSGGRFSKAIENFRTNESLECMFNGIKLRTKDGIVTVKSLKNSQIS